MIVKFIKKYSDEDQYEIEDLTIGNEYVVIGIESDSYRIINETEKEPYLYSPECFKIIDTSKPSFWVTAYGKDGEEYSYPHPWSKIDFFEDYFDENKEVRKLFWREYQKYYNNNSS